MEGSSEACQLVFVLERKDILKEEEVEKLPLLQV